MALVTGLLASVPVVASVVRAISEGWLPYDDRGLGAVRAYDVFSSHPPLVGTYAHYSLANRPSYSPGPLHYWLLAVPSHIGPVALLLTVGLVNVVSVVGVVALAGRRGGRTFMFVTAAAVALMAGSLPSEALHEMWEPFLTILPFTLLIFLCWSVACGERRLLPVTVLVASFVVQCHVAYVAAVAGLFAVAVAGLVAARRRRPPRPLRRTLAITAVVGLICWILPLVEQAIHRPGNFSNLAWYAAHRGATAGAETGWRAVVRAVGIPPWWLRSQIDASGHFADLAHAPAAFAVASCVAILVALAVIAISSVRSRDALLASAAVSALLLCGALALVAAATPTRDALVLTLSYTIDWASAVGMWTWLTIALAFGRLVRTLGPVRRPALALAAGVAVVAAAAAVVAARTRRDPAAPEFHAMDAVERRVETAVRGARAVRVDLGSTFMAYEFTMAAVYALRRDGAEPLVPTLSVDLGHWYARKARPDRVVVVRETSHSSGAAAPGTIRVAVRGDPWALGGPHALRDIVITVSRPPGA